MFTMNGPALLIIVGSLGFFLILSLTLAFRDTLQAVAEFFDPRVLRNFLRACRPRFSLASLLIATGIAPLLIGWASDLQWPRDPIVFAIVLGFWAIVVCPAVYPFFVEAFGPGPRQRCREYIKRREQRQLDASKLPGAASRDNESGDP